MENDQNRPPGMRNGKRLSNLEDRYGPGSVVIGPGVDLAAVARLQMIVVGAESYVLVLQRRIAALQDADHVLGRRRVFQLRLDRDLCRCRQSQRSYFLSPGRLQKGQVLSRQRGNGLD